MINKSFIFNNYARQELAKFIMDGTAPMPHPDEFVKYVDEFYKADFGSLCDIIYYCGYLGFCYDRDKIPEVSFERMPMPDNKIEIWLAFLEAEGAFLTFTQPTPESKKNEKVRWEDIMAYAFGEMNLLPREFYRMTMAEYAVMCNGYFWKRWRPDEQLRMVIYTIRSVFRSKKDPMPSSIEAFYPLPSDKRGISYLEEDQIKKMWEIAKKM